MGQQRKIRETVLQMLFSHSEDAQHPKNLLELLENFEMAGSPEILERVKNFCLDILQKRKEIDQKIEEVSENWKLSRMSPVDRNILRLATYELLYCEDVPLEAVLDEAIEIAKRFGTEESGSFVNGILDQVGKRNPRQKVVNLAVN